MKNILLLVMAILIFTLAGCGVPFNNVGYTSCPFNCNYKTYYQYPYYEGYCDNNKTFYPDYYYNFSTEYPAIYKCCHRVYKIYRKRIVKPSCYPRLQCPRRCVPTPCKYSK